MNLIKRWPLTLIGILGMFFGVWLCTIDGSDFASKFFVVWGYYIIVINSYKLLTINRIDKENRLNKIILILFNMTLGVLIIMFNNYILNIAIASYLLVYSLIKAFTSENKKRTFKLRLPQIILGILVLCLGEYVFRGFVILIGILIVIIFAFFLYLIFRSRDTSDLRSKFAKMYDEQNNPIKSLENDNVIDAEYTEKE